jgi:hypothetical protein
MLTIEKIKQACKQYWNRNDREHLKSRDQEGESEICLLENNETLYELNSRNNRGSKSYISNNLNFLYILPTFYLVLSLLTILILLILKAKTKERSDSDIIIKKLHIPNYYELLEINPTIYRIYTYSTSLTGLTIVFILFSVLKQRFKVPEYREDSFKLYIMLIFGIISSFFNFAKGVVPFLENYKIICQNFSENFEFKFDLSHFVFIALVFFTILFSIYSITIFNLLQNKQKLSRVVDNEENNWHSYKIILISLLSVLLLIYLIYLTFLYNDKSIIILSESINAYMNDNYKIVTAMFPYYIHILHSLLIFSMYFELKYANRSLSGNAEVDYLFENGEDEILVKGEKNEN